MNAIQPTNTPRLSPRPGAWYFALGTGSAFLGLLCFFGGIVETKDLAGIVGGTSLMIIGLPLIWLAVRQRKTVAAQISSTPLWLAPALGAVVGLSFGVPGALAGELRPATVLEIVGSFALGVAFGNACAWPVALRLAHAKPIGGQFCAVASQIACWALGLFIALSLVAYSIHRGVVWQITGYGGRFWDGCLWFLDLPTSTDRVRGALLRPATPPAVPFWSETYWPFCFSLFLLASFIPLAGAMANVTWSAMPRKGRHFSPLASPQTKSVEAAPRSLRERTLPANTTARTVWVVALLLGCAIVGVSCLVGFIATGHPRYWTGLCYSVVAVFLAAPLLDSTALKLGPEGIRLRSRNLDLTVAWSGIDEFAVVTTGVFRPRVAFNLSAGGRLKIESARRAICANFVPAKYIGFDVVLENNHGRSADELARLLHRYWRESVISTSKGNAIHS